MKAPHDPLDRACYRSCDCLLCTEERKLELRRRAMASRARMAARGIPTAAQRRAAQK